MPRELIDMCLRLGARDLQGAARPTRVGAVAPHADRSRPALNSGNRARSDNFPEISVVGALISGAPPPAARSPT